MLQNSLYGFLGVSGLILLVVVIVLWTGRRWFWQWLRGTFGFVMIGVIIWLGFAVFDVSQYRTTISDQPLVILTIYELDPQEYEVRLQTDEFNEDRYILKGDQWQLDARLLVWRGPGAAMGFEPIVKLDRLSGRYLSLQQERNSERTVYQLSGGNWVDVWSLAERVQFWLEAEFGSGVFMPMANGAEFGVYTSQGGLVARPHNEAAREVVFGFR
ncbi:MAG: hypothetical protein P1U57_03300 [Oleibacter sp.]|nr:hypothetical protein [Thalassolituus sp.]